ncbi:MAG: amidohydrolase [Chloroflexi bacterium]|nr:amidohydrolase [Chloroflexota bacterium]
MILDCHLHWRRWPDHFPQVQTKGMTEEQFNQAKARSERTAERALKDMGEAGVDKGILVGLKSGRTHGVEVPNELIAEAAKPHAGKLYWGPAVYLNDHGAADELEHCIRDLGAVAIGELSPGYGNYSLADPACSPAYEVAIAYDIPMLIHAGPVGTAKSYLKYANLDDLDEMCVNFPKLKVVLCHMGEPRYHEAANLLSRHANLYADVSMMPLGGGVGTGPGGGKPTVFHPFPHLDEPILYWFSMPSRNPNKLLWASDVQNPKESIEGFRGINGRLKKMGYPTIPEESIERMFHENWKPVFTKIKA